MNYFRSRVDCGGSVSSVRRGCIFYLGMNVRGVNDRDKRKVIKALIKSHKVNLVCL